MNVYLKNWSSVSLSIAADIRSAMEKLDQVALQIVLVVDNDNKLLGTITDGDIRRGLLVGKSLDAPVTEIINDSPMVGFDFESEMAWHRKMQRKLLRHLPIVDDEDKIVGLYHQKRADQRLTNPVVLMLGGLGTRLRPLTETVPKPMLKVGNRPILETILTHIADQGFEEFYFCINYLGDQIRQYFGDGSRFGVKIHYIEENDRMGTAGALSLIAEKFEQPFVVMNGDLLTKIDLAAMLDFHQIHQNQITAGVREYSQQVPYGVVEIDGPQVTQLVEKPIYRYFVNGGIYMLSPECMIKIPDDEFYDMTTLIEEMLAEQGKVGAFPITEYWMDIGQMPDYHQAQNDYLIHFHS